MSPGGRAGQTKEPAKPLVKIPSTRSAALFFGGQAAGPSARRAIKNARAEGDQAGTRCHDVLTAAFLAATALPGADERPAGLRGAEGELVGTARCSRRR